MNKYLMLSAAAALATGVAGNANAGHYSVHFLGVYGTSYCDGYIGGTRSGAAAGVHYWQVCASLGESWLQNVQVIGGEAKNKRLLGKAYYFSDDSLAMTHVNTNQGASAWNSAMEFDLAAPIVAGSKWALWVSFGGTSAFEGNRGTLVAGQYAKANGRNKNVETSISKVAKLLRGASSWPAR